ncbi:MAG: SDR family oxidoreductase [Eubacteriales bacterium]|nr:SDR family oxidoreductase [Eubacteriales bacterium]
MKTLLITGGSRGIGATIVKEFAKNAWRVVFGYNRHEDEALALAKETGAIAIQADLTKKDQTARFIDEALMQLGHVDALILNAGTSYRGMFSDMPLENFEELFQLHLLSPTQILQGVLPHMRSVDRGSVVFISSIWGRHASALEAAYSAVKAGQIRLCEALAKEEGSRNIRFNAICPGPVKTAMMENFTESEMQEIKYACALNRLPEVSDIAELAYFLCTEKAGGITGQAITLDCGFTV